MLFIARLVLLTPTQYMWEQVRHHYDIIIMSSVCIFVQCGSGPHLTNKLFVQARAGAAPGKLPTFLGPFPIVTNGVGEVPGWGSGSYWSQSVLKGIK